MRSLWYLRDLFWNLIKYRPDDYDKKGIRKMEIKFAQAQDIDAWMTLVERVRDSFPGLETADALEEHKATVLHFMKEFAAICAVDKQRIIGTLLFSKENSKLCFLAVDPTYRRRHIARQLVFFALTQMEKGRDIIVTTYREDDSNGAAARAFYKCLGFSESRLTEEFGYPAQEFVLIRSAAGQV